MGTSEVAIETAEKEGFRTNITAKHPFRDGHELPVYVANFVLMEYGSGAIFGCPAHDQRDLDFARKYELDVIPVVAPEGVSAGDMNIENEAFVDDGQQAAVKDLLRVDLPQPERGGGQGKEGAR